jgi:hypothetical protein
MCLRGVSCELIIAIKALVAQFAGILPVIIVSIHVVLLVTDGGEAFGTMLTLVWLLFCVNSLVHLQVRIAFEFSVAVGMLTYRVYV